jgi:hypothetical protein
MQTEDDVWMSIDRVSTFEYTSCYGYLQGPRLIFGSYVMGILCMVLRPIQTLVLPQVPTRHVLVQGWYLPQVVLVWWVLWYQDQYQSIYIYITVCSSLMIPTQHWCWLSREIYYELCWATHWPWSSSASLRSQQENTI